MEISLFGDTRGLSQRFGPGRIRNTPISEPLITGIDLGSAAHAPRRVAHMQFAIFTHTGF